MVAAWLLNRTGFRRKLRRCPAQQRRHQRQSHSNAGFFYRQSFSILFVGGEGPDKCLVTSITKIVIHIVSICMQWILLMYIHVPMIPHTVYLLLLVFNSVHVYYCCLLFPSIGESWSHPKRSTKRTFIGKMVLSSLGWYPSCLTPPKDFNKREYLTMHQRPHRFNFQNHPQHTCDASIHGCVVD